MSEESLTGRWIGRYAYRSVAGRPVPFEADLVETAGLFSGQTVEPNTFARRGGTELVADISGSRIGTDVEFSKTYLGGDEGAIAYLGEANGDLTRIDGRWHFPHRPQVNGSFVMMREPKAEAKATREIEAVPQD